MNSWYYAYIATYQHDATWSFLYINTIIYIATYVDMYIAILINTLKNKWCGGTYRTAQMFDGEKF